MGIQFFGEYLIENWVVTREQLLEALDLQEFRNLKFGELAQRKNYLSNQQVATVNHRQLSEDRRFGDIAVELGYLQADQMLEILTLQKNSYLFLGEALLELGHVSEDILERELTLFSEDQARYHLGRVEVPGQLSSRLVIGACVDLTHKLFVRVVGMLIKTGRPVLFLGGELPTREAGCVLTVGVQFTGARELQYLLSVSHDVAVAIASRVLKEDATRESYELIEDAVREFCNFVCGNASAKLAQQGIHVEILAPESLQAIPGLTGGHAMVHYPIHLAEGAVDLRFAAPLTQSAALAAS